MSSHSTQTIQRILIHSDAKEEIAKLPSPERVEQVKKMVAAYHHYFPGSTDLDLALDFFEGGVLDRGEAEEVSQVDKKSFSRDLTRRRRARKAQR